MGSTTRLGPRLAHGLLEDVRQGGVYSKLSRTNLVGLLGKLDSIIELGLFYCNRQRLDTCPYPLPNIKRGTVHPLYVQSYKPIQCKRPHATLKSGVTHIAT
jgi:hypothetical protein